MNRILSLLVVFVGLCSCGDTEDTDANTQVAKPLVLVTGATGRQGGAVARELLRRGYKVRGITRNPESSRATELVQLGIEMVKGDFDDAASLDVALDGAYGLFGVTDFWEHGYDREIQHGRNLIDAASRSNIQHLVFSSVASANQDTGIPHFDSKWEVEKYLRKSRLSYTVIRPVSFMENWSLASEDIVSGELVTAGAPDKAHQYISVRDIGRFVVDAFDSPRVWSGQSFDIAGDEMSLIELSGLLSQITGRKILPKLITWEEHEAQFGEESTIMSKWFDRAGYSVDVAGLRKKYRGMATLSEYFRNLSLAESEIDAAGGIVNRAIAAHGGSTLESLRSIVQEWRTNDEQVYESRSPTPPWDKVQRWEGFAVDFDTGHYAEARIDRAGGYDRITGVIINEHGNHRLDYRNDSYRKVPLTLDQAITDMAAWSPVVLLRWLSENPRAARYVSRRAHASGLVDHVDVAIAGEDIAVLFDVDSGRVRALERSYVDYDGTRIPLRLAFSDYVVESGIHHPSAVELQSYGFPARRASLVHAKFNGSIDPHLLVPTTFNPTPGEPDGIRDFRIEELATGVLFVGEGVMFQLIVEFDDFLVALDASSGDVMKRIAAIKAKIPDKEFRYVLASHHHNDHLHGLDEFAAAGAGILAVPAHTETIVRYLATQNPDVAPSIISVDDDFVIRSGDRELQILDIGPVPHSEHMLVAYLPREKILFEADLFVLGGRRSPTRPATENGEALLESIDARGLDVEFIVDPHSPMIATIGDLRSAVALREERGSEIPAAARANLKEWRTAAGEL